VILKLCPANGIEIGTLQREKNRRNAFTEKFLLRFPSQLTSCQVNIKFLPAVLIEEKVVMALHH
jgi:hypothetical protein